MQIRALLGPTNTGKTHRAVERMLEHESGIIGLPLRLLAREIYDRITARLGEGRVALVTGEEKRVPSAPRYWVCTAESMPRDREVDFVAVDEVQLAAHRQRGHTFTDRLLHHRGRLETWFLGSDTMAPVIEELVPTAHVERHPRFSKLSYIGTVSVGALPPRTAVVAFSAEDVYALAEQLRRKHGGTAVVLGALSPRTRNAQVAMYQAGEVHHMVATDAIGMGLNMDVDRVVFASLNKFDGRESRPLELAEMAQIAGRAGRYTTDGGFGILRPGSSLSPRVVASLEGHRFPPVRRVVWRNGDLDFSSLDALIGALRERPTRRILRLVERADDYEALLSLARRELVRSRVKDENGVRLLWDVARIPDFRKLLFESHVEFLAAIWEQLSAPPWRIDEDWMATRLRRLDDTEGDIETLMMRIAFIRTWTTVTHHESWVHDATHWQQRTREIEDRCSDALHERLTARFVESASDAPANPLARRRGRRPPPPVAPPSGDSPFASLHALQSQLPGAAPEPDSLDTWVHALVEAPFDAFELGADGKVRYDEQVLARLRRGPDALHPEVVLTADELGAGARSRIHRRLLAWVRDVVAAMFAPLSRLPDDLGPEARGLCYQLEQGLGVVERHSARHQLSRLREDETQTLRKAGVVLGNRYVYLAPISPRHRTVTWRAALWSAFAQPPSLPALPGPQAVSFEPTDEVDPAFYRTIGFPIVAGRAVRADQLERAAERLRTLGPGPWDLPPEIPGWLGVRRRRAESIVKALGYRPTGEGWGPAKPRRRGRRRARAE